MSAVLLTAQDSDWNLERPDGLFEAWARYLLRTDDGALLTITNTALFRIVGTGLEARTVARFEVGADRYRWLTRAVLVGRLVVRDATRVDIRLYRVD